MTVQDDTYVATYSGDGATTVFPVPFYFIANDDVRVIHRAGATETVWTEGTEYTLTGAGEPGGGSLTVKTSPTDYTPGTGETLTVKRAEAFTQPSAFPAGGELPSGTLERAFDRATMLAQQLLEKVDRCLSVPETDGAASLTLPIDSDRATKTLAFDAEGTPALGPTVSEIANAETHAASAAASADAAAGSETGAAASAASAGASADAAAASAASVNLPQTPVENDMLVMGPGGWLARTIAQVRSHLSLGTAALEDVAAGGSAGLLRADGDGSQLSGAFRTGMILPAFLAAAPAGWLLLDGETIGDAGSGATHAEANLEALFTALWDNLADSEAPVSGGRGASAAADWSAGKTLTLPDGRGRSLIGAGTGAGLTARTLGDAGGGEDAVVVAHDHGLSAASVAAAGGHNHTISPMVGSGEGSSGFQYSLGNLDSPASTGTAGNHSHSLSGSTDSAGASGVDANLPPWLAANWMIKT